MGVDIYGIAPKLTSEPMSFPENYKDLSEEEKEDYWQKRNQWENENPGYYFRNNWWHWRPIVSILESVNKSADLGITHEEFELMSENSGGGVKSSEKCIKMANALDQIVNNMKEQGVEYVYLNTKWWHYSVINSEGRQQSVNVEDKEISEAISNFIGNIDLIFKLPVINGIEYKTSHGTNVENLQEFAVFLRNCNGFQVY